MELSLQSKFRTKPILDKRYAMIKMEKIKSNSKMSYDRFQELYVEYGEGYEEIFFAYAFLDIEELRYKKSYKEKQSPAMVLTRQAVLENPNDLLELRKKIIYDEGLHINGSIDFKRFCELYAKYGAGMSDIVFAGEVLDISSRAFSRIKGTTRSTTIFADVEITEEDIIKLRDKIAILNKLEGGQVLEYEKLQAFHKKYAPELLERDFAVDVLEVKAESYRYCANGTNNGITILTSKVTNFELLRNKVIREQKLHYDDQIDYARFQQLHQRYAPNMSEVVFAEKILDITSSNFSRMKHREGKIRILLSAILPSKQETSKLREKIIRENQIKAMDPINLEELQNLHEKYGGIIPFSMFAIDVLLMSDQFLKGLKQENKGGKKPTACVLLRYEMPLEEIQQLKNTIREENNLKEPKSMNKTEIEELYKRYGGIMPFNMFLRGILGIQRKSFENLKYGVHPSAIVCVRDGLDDNEVSEVNRLLARELSDKKISQSMDIPVAFLRMEMKKLSNAGRLYQGSYWSERVGYLVTEKKKKPLEVATELGVQLKDVSELLRTYKEEKEKEKIRKKKIERNSKKRTEMKEKAMRAILEITPRSQKTIRTYVNECRIMIEAGEFEEEDLEFLGECMTNIQCNYEDIEVFSRMCVSFRKYSLASKFIGENINNSSISKEERERLQMLNDNIRYAVKREMALSMICNGETDISRIMEKTGALEVDIVKMQKRIGTQGSPTQRHKIFYDNIIS